MYERACHVPATILARYATLNARSFVSVSSLTTPKMPSPYTKTATQDDVAAGWGFCMTGRDMIFDDIR